MIWGIKNGSLRKSLKLLFFQNFSLIYSKKKALELYKVRYQNEKDSFKKGIVNPNLLKPIIASKEVSLSPYFRYGCVSVRKFFSEIKKLYDKVKSINKDKYYFIEKKN